VSVSGSLSEGAPVTSGIMQGSVIGPVLFLLFINDLLESLSKAEVTAYAYADDIKLYSPDPVKLQNALYIVQAWCTDWQLSLSVNKCQVLLLSSSQERPLVLFNQPLPYCDSIRDLGITMDRDLSFSTHCSELAKRVKRSCCIISKCFSSGRVDPLLRAYKTYIRPKLESSCQVFNSIGQADSNILEKCQKYFTRLLFYKCGLGKRSYDDRLKFLHLQTLK
jgi:ribonuclease P/MRP protein subunit RPP40